MDDATSRTRLFLAQLTERPDDLATELSKQSITLYLRDVTPAGEIAVAMAATLLLRMEGAAPSISLVASGDRTTTIPRLDDGPLLDALAKEHAGFASLERFSGASSSEGSLEIAFDSRSPGMPIGTSGWNVSIGLVNERENAGNPVAAAIAGALAANEILKRLLLSTGVPLQRAPRVWNGSFSIWDYAVPAGAPGPTIIEPVNLDSLGFVGCGGVSGACFWALGLFDLVGDPLLVDDDVVDVTNLNRLLFANHDEVGSHKVDLVKALLDAKGANALAYRKRWEQIGMHERERALLLVVSVDDDAVRRQIQADLPRIIFNGGTSDAGEYQISRHNFVDDACLACISHGDKTSRSIEEATASHLGIPLDAFLRHINGNGPLPGDLIDASSVNEEMKEELRHLSARRILQRFCNELAVNDDTAVSAPTLSALPGLLLAAEVIKSSLNPVELGKHNLLRGSVLRGPHKRWLLALGKRAGCICVDPLYRDHYRRRHR